MEHNVLREQLTKMQKKVEILEQKVALRQEALLEVETKANELKKEHQKFHGKH